MGYFVGLHKKKWKKKTVGNKAAFFRAYRLLCTVGLQKKFFCFFFEKKKKKAVENKAAFLESLSAFLYPTEKADRLSKKAALFSTVFFFFQKKTNLVL